MRPLAARGGGRDGQEKEEEDEDVISAGASHWIVQLHGKIGNGELQTRLPVSGFLKGTRAFPELNFKARPPRSPTILPTRACGAFVCGPARVTSRSLCREGV